MTIPSRLPGVTYAQLPITASAASALSLPPRLVVIHDTSNDASAAAEARYAASRSLSGATSAHFYIDTTGPLGSLPLNLQAWAAYSYANSHGWHLEMCGYNAGMTGAVPAKTIGLTAILVRQLCDLAGIPMVKLSPADVAAGKRGICGHWDITTGLGVGTHDDPGPAFDWAAFVAAVKGDTVSKAEVLDALDDQVAYTSQSVAQWAAANGWGLVSTRALAEYTMRTTQETAAAVAALAAKVDKLPAPAPAPVDAAALKAVMLDPEVVAVYAKAAADLVHADLAD